MKRFQTYKHNFQLERGDIIYIKGIPYEYLGDGVIGGSTPVCACADVPEGIGAACGMCTDHAKPGPVSQSSVQRSAGQEASPLSKAAMRKCKTKGCNVTFGPESTGLPVYCPDCESKQGNKTCKCIQPCECPAPEGSSVMTVLQEFVKRLEEENNPVRGGLILDPHIPNVYGPGCCTIGVVPQLTKYC